MSCMTVTDAKTDLRRYLQDAREALPWKLEGLAEHDIRRPLVPTGTNLSGWSGTRPASSWVLWRHLRPIFGRPVAWDDSYPNSDMFAKPDESRDFISGRYRRARA
jgi:hypothetical protein